MTSERRYLRLMWRSSLTSTTVLSLDELLDALPGNADEHRAWVADNVSPIGRVSGTVVYRWGDVVAAIEARIVPATTVWLTTKQVAERFGIARSTLDEMVQAAPPDLPGAPLQVGSGSRRRHLRWDASTVDTWLAAVSDLDESRSGERKPPLPRRRSRLQAHGHDVGTAVDWSSVARRGLKASEG